jgi:hypothetical protein
MLFTLLSAGALLALLPAPSGAITGGQPDEGRHPEVGGTVLPHFPTYDRTIVNLHRDADLEHRLPDRGALRQGRD